MQFFIYENSLFFKKKEQEPKNNKQNQNRTYGIGFTLFSIFIWIEIQNEEIFTHKILEFILDQNPDT
jgi:hypothetical protein